MNIFIYTPLEKELQVYLKNHLPEDFQLSFLTEIDTALQRPTFETSEILLGNPPAEWFSEKDTKLRFWQLDSAGFEKYSHLKLSFPVANMGSFFAESCAETMLAGILALYRCLPELIEAKQDREWIKDKVRYKVGILSSKQVMILGAGNIGMALKQMLQGFGCSIKLAAQTNPKADFHSFEEVLDALSDTDVVINTLPGAADNYVSSDFIDAMKVGSIYGSVGRGNTTDEKALIAALQAGKISGAVLDVTKGEPLPVDNPLWTLDHVILTQHSAGGREGENEGKVTAFISNLNNFLKGLRIENQVDLRRGY
jgi:glyoxylate/hydroxypyruvate reductase